MTNIAQKKNSAVLVQTDRIILYVLSCLDVQVALSRQEAQDDPGGDNMT